MSDDEKEDDVFPDPPPGLVRGSSVLDDNNVMWSLSWDGMLRLQPFSAWVTLHEFKVLGTRATADGYVTTIEARPRPLMFTAPLWDFEATPEEIEMVRPLEGKEPDA